MRRPIFVLAVLTTAALPNAAPAQSATASASAARVITVNELSSAIGVLARQTALSGDQAATSVVKGLETAADAINGQSVALAAGRSALDAGGTSPRACPEVSAARARNRAATDLAATAAGSGTDDARAISSGTRDVRRPDAAGGEAASIVAVGMPLPLVPKRDGSVLTEAARAEALRRAAFLMAARGGLQTSLTGGSR